MSQWVFIEPQDVWLFRDGRPFGAGGAARSAFPPSPQTLQGALRALLLHHSGVSDEVYRSGNAPASLYAQMGRPQGDLGQFGMRGPFVARQFDNPVVRVVRYSPVPADVAYDKNGRSYFCLHPGLSGDCQSDLSDDAGEMQSWRPLVAPPDQLDFEQPDGLWLREDNLQAYLRPSLGGFVAAPANELFDVEPRLGIGMDYKAKRPLDGHLYTVEFTRAEDHVGLLVELTGTTRLPAAEGWLALGGEQRAARYRVVPAAEVEAGTSFIQTTLQLKVVLLTHAYFTGGWQPTGGWAALFGGQAVRLVSAALGRPRITGGWDVARNWHKTSYPLVPAGSVFYFEADGPITPPSQLTETPPGEPPYAQMGFGVVATGEWN